MFISVVRMQRISVDFTSCGLLLLKEAVPDFIVLFIFTSVGECKVKEPTTLTEVRIEVLRANVSKNRATGGDGQK